MYHVALRTILHMIVHYFNDDRHMVVSRMEQYVRVLRENCLTFMRSDMRLRLHYILGSLVNQALYHRDVIDSE